MLGDSISRAVNAAAPGERPASSWATGTDPTDGVESIAERIHARQPAITMRVFNDAESGARVEDLPAQAARAVQQRAELVLVLIGANDACRRDITQMTSVDEYRARFDEAAGVLRAGLPPGALVFVVSVPDLYGVWAAEHDNAQARALWRTVRACPSLLAENATAEQRAAVRDRVAAYDAALAEDAARYHFWTDGGALARASFTGDDLSRFDAFHPSMLGQAQLAAAAWDAGPYR